MARQREIELSAPGTRLSGPGDSRFRSHCRSLPGRYQPRCAARYAASRARDAERAKRSSHGPRCRARRHMRCNLASHAKTSLSTRRDPGGDRVCLSFQASQHGSGHGWHGRLPGSCRGPGNGRQQSAYRYRLADFGHQRRARCPWRCPGQGRFFRIEPAAGLSGSGQAEANRDARLSGTGRTELGHAAAQRGAARALSHREVRWRR